MKAKGQILYYTPTANKSDAKKLCTFCCLFFVLFCFFNCCTPTKAYNVIIHPLDKEIQLLTPLSYLILYRGICISFKKQRNDCLVFHFTSIVKGCATGLKGNSSRRILVLSLLQQIFVISINFTLCLIIFPLITRCIKNVSHFPMHNTVKYILIRATGK